MGYQLPHYHHTVMESTTDYRRDNETGEKISLGRMTEKKTLMNVAFDVR